MFLNDERYENERGESIHKAEIETLGTYRHQFDGFFEWQCGNCNKVHRTRAFKIGGVVFPCPNCNKKNLLVRTDIKFINQKMANADRNDTSAEQRIAKALYHLGQGIAELGRR